jgi:hypothetical protein
MTVVAISPSIKEARKEIKAMRSVSKKIVSSKESARAYLRAQGFIKKNGALTQKYGG